MYSTVDIAHTVERLLASLDSIGEGLVLLNAKSDKMIELLEEIKNNRDYSDF